MQFIHTMDVPKPAAAVHAYVSDFKNLPRWDPTIVKVEQTTPGPVGQGTRYVVVLKFVGSETTLDYQVREYAPPISAMLVGVASSAVATDKITIEPTPTGSRLTWHADITLSWPAKILDPLLKLFFAGDVKKAMANLERELNELPQTAMQSGAREVQGLSRKQLARLVRVDEGTLWRWEQGMRAPKGRLAVVADAILGVVEIVATLNRGRMGWPLAADDIQEIRRLRADGLSLRETGRRVGVAANTVTVRRYCNV